MTAWMDTRISDLNPCSLETIAQSVEVTDTGGTYRVWPLMLSCYQLSEQDSTRRGSMELHLVNVPDDGSPQSLEFGKPYTILSPSESSGILDGKWTEMSSSSPNESSWCFATAHSTGEIRLQSFCFGGVLDQSEKPFCTTFLGQSEVGETENAPLCLSLKWDRLVASDQKKIVSTYSNGTVELHEVHLSSSTGAADIVRKEAWQAHTMFQTPTEVWSACLVQDSVVSCGDDGSYKLWDIRCLNKPSCVIRTFDAGVTCAHAHVANPNIFAVGSYDESICIHDIRYMSDTQSLLKTGSLGGGIWRIKWHPYQNDRILVGAMHAGCRVLELEGFDNTEGSDAKYKVTKEFTAHESMAYGADWLCYQDPNTHSVIEAAASCSFYDKSVYLWKTYD
jgi:diphthamide biosynthesis protein 7